MLCVPCVAISLLTPVITRCVLGCGMCKHACVCVCVRACVCVCVCMCVCAWKTVEVFTGKTAEG